MVKNWLQLLFLVLFAPTLQAATTANEELLLREILGKHWEAIGGIENWSKIESIQLSGTVTRDKQSVDICIVKKRPDRIRATVTVPVPGSEEEELQLIQAYDGKLAWTATRVAGTREMINEAIADENALATLRADAGVLPKLLKLWQDGVPLTILGTSLVDESPAVRIRTSAVKDRHTYTFYIDMGTHRVVKMERNDPQVGITTTTYHDYRKLDGIYLASRTVVQSPQTGLSEMNTDRIKVGVGIYPEYFQNAN